RKAAADTAAVAQLSILITPQQQRGKTATGPGRRRIASHHKLLPARALDLQPVPRAGRAIRCVGTFADDAFTTAATDLSKDLRAVADDVCTVAQGSVSGRGLEQRLQKLLAFQQGELAQVLPVQEQQVEGKVLQGTAALEVTLQRGERRSASAGRHDLAIDKGAAAGQGVEGRQQVLKTLAPVETRAGVESRAGLAVRSQAAIAIELGFVQPLVALRRLSHQGGQLRFLKGGVRQQTATGLSCLAACLSIGGFAGFTPALLRDWFCGSDGVHAAPAHDAVLIARDQSVRVFAGFIVAFLNK